MHLLSSLSLLAVGASALAVDRPSDARLASRSHASDSCQADLRPKALTYYTNWAMYGAKYFATDIPAHLFTHLSYAFCNVSDKTGEVLLSDTYSDLQFKYPGDKASNDPKRKEVFGNVKQLYLLKKKYRNLKMMLPVGGWSFSAGFPAMLASEEKRKTFVRSLVKHIKNLGFDGAEVDYEYVANKEEAAQMVELLRLLREALDDLKKEVGADKAFNFLLSFSAPAGKKNYQKLDFEGMTPYLDFYNFMAVDYMGAGFSANSGYLDNVYPDKVVPEATEFDTQSGIHYYIHEGKIPSSKILLQSPCYGRSFNNTAGIGKPYTDAGSLGSLGAAGTWRYRDLPVEGYNAAVTTNTDVIGSYSYDAEKKYLIAYDTPEVARLKAAYAKKEKLGGLSWWEVSQDRTDSESLISAAINAYGGPDAFEQSQNNLAYPTSDYDNLREGFPDN